MTDEQINKAISEACGWECLAPDVWHHGIVGYSKDTHGIVRSRIPDYCNDLNAMHESEKTIFPFYATVYSNKLARVTGAEMSDDTDYFCATARQRAEAFLRALGKWEEAV